MKKLRKIFILGTLMGSAVGIIIPISNVHLFNMGLSTNVAGWITALYFFAMILGSKIYNKFIGKFQVYQFVVIALFLSATATIGFVLCKEIILWAFFIFIIGIGVSFNFITIQSYLNQSEVEKKTSTTGIYAFCYAVGFAISVTLGPILYEKSKYLAFVSAACLMFLDASIIFVFKLKINLKKEEAARLSIEKVFPFLTGGFVYGFIENAMTAFYTIYLLEFYTLKHAGVILSFFLAGGMLGIIPLTYFSDKTGLVKSCLIYAFFASIGMILILCTNYKIHFSSITGAFLGSLYPITLAGLNYVGLEKEQLIKATSYYTISYSLGSTLGPIIAGYIMSLLGGNGLLISCIFLLIIFIVTIVLSVINKWILLERND
ncbi:MAG: MFS transporter [Lachnospiraceae bacterium]|uniref:MFS transporter n=1 Tax=uncultured Clostridium sp. TaxID=59620 RepID=UPI00272AC015|nr:MFS transporter [uncultured Clostridium sp.]MCI8751990.1 MFS transporter [Lachnospiraceae bacterium]